MAAANATRNRGRTALTASAVTVGISLVVAFSALGGSVLGSIGSYLEGSLGGDYVVQPTGGNYGVTFSRDLERRISKLPGVAEATGIGSDFRRKGEDVYLLFGLDRDYPDIFRLNYEKGGPDAFSKLRSGGVLVGEQLASSRDLTVGSTLSIPSPSGNRRYRVAGVVANDFLGGGTGVYLSREALAKDFGVKEDSLVAIKAEPGEAGTVGREVRRVLEDYPQLTLLSSAGYNEQLRGEFEQQYVFFYAIMGVSVAVSAFGVVNTLSMSVFERRREIGVLRAVGTTRLQVGRLILDEGVVISTIGCILGLALGSALGYLFVRGSAASGFEVAFFYPTVPALLSLLAGLVIGILAGLLPARSAARTNIVEAVRYE
jgi:putative ABC transport system permease protein